MNAPRQIPDDPRTMPEPPIDEPEPENRLPERVGCPSCRRGDGGRCTC